MKALLVAAFSMAAMTLSPPAGTPDYRSGWCDGFNAAFDQLQHNREHYRSLLMQPKMSPDQVIDWIYARPWIDGPTSHTAPRTLDQPSGEPQVGPGPIESVDLYLMLPAQCQMPTS